MKQFFISLLLLVPSYSFSLDQNADIIQEISSESQSLLKKSAPNPKLKIFFRDIHYLAKFDPSQGRDKGKYMDSLRLRQNVEKKWTKLRAQLSEDDQRNVETLLVLRRDGKYIESKALAPLFSEPMSQNQNLSAETLESYKSSVLKKLNNLKIERQTKVDANKIKASAEKSSFALSAKKPPTNQSEASDHGRLNNSRVTSTTVAILSVSGLLLLFIGLGIMRSPHRSKKAKLQNGKSSVLAEPTKPSFSQNLYQELIAEGIFDRPQAKLGMRQKLRDQVNDEIGILIGDLKGDFDLDRSRDILKSCFVSFQEKINLIKQSNDASIEAQELIYAYREVLEILKLGGNFLKKKSPDSSSPNIAA